MSGLKGLKRETTGRQFETNAKLVMVG